MNGEVLRPAEELVVDGSQAVCTDCRCGSPRRAAAPTSRAVQARGRPGLGRPGPRALLGFTASRPVHHGFPDRCQACLRSTEHRLAGVELECAPVSYTHLTLPTIYSV